MLGSGADRAVEIEFIMCPIARPSAQTLERDLDVAGAEFHAVVEIVEFTLVPDLDGATVAAFVLADAHALGVVAIGPEGRRARRADPLGAALMPPLLFLPSLLESLHQLVEAAECLDLGLFLGAEMLFGHLFKPVGGQVHR